MSKAEIKSQIAALEKKREEFTRATSTTPRGGHTPESKAVAQLIKELGTVTDALLVALSEIESLRAEVDQLRK